MPTYSVDDFIDHYMADTRIIKQQLQNIISSLKFKLEFIVIKSIKMKTI